jgi:hypothetical protein
LRKEAIFLQGVENRQRGERDDYALFNTLLRRSLEERD